MGQLSLLHHLWDLGWADLKVWGDSTSGTRITWRHIPSHVWPRCCLLAETSDWSWVRTPALWSACVLSVWSHLNFLTMWWHGFPRRNSRRARQRYMTFQCFILASDKMSLLLLRQRCKSSDQGEGTWVVLLPGIIFNIMLKVCGMQYLVASLENTISCRNHCM